MSMPRLDSDDEVEQQPTPVPSKSRARKRGRDEAGVDDDEGGPVRRSERSAVAAASEMGEPGPAKRLRKR